MRSSLLKLSAAAALAIGAFGAVVPTVTAAPDDGSRVERCFWARNVENFAYVDSRTVNLRVSGRRVYQLTLFNACHDIDYAHAVRLDTRGFSSICRASDMTLIVGSPIGPQRCMVQTLRQLSADEVAALPSRQRP